ncbi:acetate--CoA ligase family protein [Ramlibacter sp.]|uniref:acetate--CoA ligase family protein n=1 Tax=Ramlibacter sp. TaxID=1917967 RepID=UPI003D099514
MTNLEQLLNPRSVAVIGASEDQTKFGGRLYRTLLRHNYSGRVFPINPARETLFGLKTYPGVAATPEAPDMAVMAVPTAKVKGEVQACAQRGVKAAIIITSKFSDAGPEGAALEAEIVEEAARGGMRIIGPNCLGLISPANKLVLCSSPALDVDTLIESPIGLVSQSGALMGTLFDRAHGMGIGFSHCVSVGNQADLELCDFIEFLIDDPRTRVLCSYVEGVKSPARVVQLARRAREAGKPWLMVKAGASDEGSRAAYSHTASLAGDYASLAAMCAHENIVLMDDAHDMVALAGAMVRYPGRKVRNAAVLTISGGAGALAADRLSEAGVPLAQFSESTMQRFAQHYPPGQAANPIDIGARRNEMDEVGAASAEIALSDPGCDLGLVAMTTAPDVPGLTRYLAQGAAREAAQGKPMLYVMLPGRVAAPAREFLKAEGLPCVDTTASAASMLRAWKRWSDYVEPSEPARPPGRRATIPATREELGALGEAASKALVASAGLHVNDGVVVRTADEAIAQAARLGYPVVLKIVSADISHKSDVGGVELGIADADDLRRRFARMRDTVATRAPQARIDGFFVQAQLAGDLELLVGARHDAQFGPQLVVGAGGVLVELFKDIQVLPAPAHPDTVRAALARLKVAPLLQAWRGRGELDAEAVVDAVVRLGWLAADIAAAHPGLDFEIEVNPLIVGRKGRGAFAVDARARIGSD